MPGGGFSNFFLRLLRVDGRRRRRRRHHGAGGRRRHNRNLQHLQQLGLRRRRFGGRRHGGDDGAGPSGFQAQPPVPFAMPEARPLPAWILAGPAAPNLYADEEMEPESDEMEVDDPELAAPPPPPPCCEHGWACPRLAANQAPVEEEAEPGPPAAPSPPGSPDLPSPTPAHELVNAGATSSSTSIGRYLPAPVNSFGDFFSNGAGSSAAPSPPPSRRIRFIVSRSVLEASRAGRRTEEQSHGLSNGHANGVVPGMHLAGGSSSSEEDGAPGSTAPRR